MIILDECRALWGEPGQISCGKVDDMTTVAKLPLRQPIKVMMGKTAEISISSTWVRP